jgi:predicted nucleic acid-binding protein
MESVATIPQSAATQVIIDAVIWSKSYRRKTLDEKSRNIVDELDRLIAEDRTIMAGAVRQEILSGISDRNTFEALRQKLSRFRDYLAQSEDHILAAEFFNICRIHGIQGSSTDFLICAIAARNDWAIFTEDGDFQRYQRYLPIRLHQIETPLAD